MVYKGNNVVGALMSMPIFVGTFSVVTDFAVLEDMDAYRNKGMGDVIFGKPFLREVGIKAKRFEGMITIYNGNDEVTYQMVRSHPRFKRHTNKQCNKIPPLLKVSEKDEKNGILLHGFLEVTAAQVYNGNYAKWFGINKWYQSIALRNFDLEDMELEFTISGPTAKLPTLKLGELTFSQYPDAKSMFAAIGNKIWRVKKTIGTSSGGQILAFMTAPSTSNTNDANTACPQGGVLQLVRQLGYFAREWLEHQEARKVSFKIRTHQEEGKQLKDTSLKAMLAIVVVGFDGIQVNIEKNKF
ncbi:hypothetical protein Tco_1235170 [Tanacetum coccineum]